MLNSMMQNNTLFYAIAALTVLGTVWMLMVNAFFGRTIRDMDKMESPKGKWMKRFIKNLSDTGYETSKDTECRSVYPHTAEQGQKLRSFIYQLKRWSGYCGLACIILMGIGLYGTYIYDYSQMARYQYLLAGVLSSLILLLLRPFLCFGRRKICCWTD